MIKGIRALVRHARGSTVLPWVLLIIGITISVALYSVIHDNVESTARERFDHQAIEARQIIERRILSYAEVLYGARGLFSSDDSVSAMQFHRFVQSLDLKGRFPGFDSLNLARYVRAEDKPQFVKSMRHSTTFDGKPLTDFDVKPRGDRPEYFVLVYLEPLKGFESLLGLDIGANPAVAASDQEAMLALQHFGRDSGKLFASGLPIHIKAPTEEYVGLAMRLPVYRNGMPLDTVEQRRAAYLGSVGAGFNTRKLMSGVLDEKTMQHLRFSVYGPAVKRSGSDVSIGERLLFDSDQLARGQTRDSEAFDADSVFSMSLPMQIAGRTWEIRFSAPREAIVNPADRLFPASVLVGGLLSSFLLFGVLYSLSTSRSQAVRLAAEMTKNLRETEERFRLISENATDLIELFDPEGRRVYSNPAYARLLGNREPSADVLGDVHPDDRERVWEIFRKTLQTGVGELAEFRFLLPDGNVRHIESQASVVRNPDGSAALLVVVSRDVTERKLTEEALRAREVQLGEAQALAKLGTWEWDVRKDTRVWSEQTRRNFGVPDITDPITLNDFLALVHPEDRDRMQNTLRKAVEAGNSYESEFRVVNPSGMVRTIYARARIDRDESGRAVRMLGVSQDISDQKRAEEHMRASEERFRMMVENVRDYAIHMLDTEGYITSWNLGAERIIGYQAEEIVGRHYSRFFLPEHAARGDPGMQLQFAAIQGRYESEGWRVTKNGTRFWAHVIVTPMHDASGKLRGFSNITHDITERKRAEEDLQSYAEQLKSMSRRVVELQETERRALAAELHDRAGQALTALGLNLSIIAHGISSEASPELASRLEECSSLVRETVDAMRDVMKELRPIVLDDYGLPAALRALSTGFSERTGIRVDFKGGDSQTNLPKPVDLAMFRIAQEAFNNIAKHSRAKHVEIALSRVNGHATLSIRDDGVGFDPKRADASNPESGWGLLIMRERAEAVGAQFKVDTGSGGGVQVRVEYNI